ncbi:hypothetical protein GCM10027448_27520 [Nocardioides dilutus]
MRLTATIRTQATVITADPGVTRAGAAVLVLMAQLWQNLTRGCRTSGTGTHLRFRT